jgi:hypothetical protein
MGSVSHPALVAALQSALMHQGFSALLVFAVLATGWVMVREWRPELARRRAQLGRRQPRSEPAARMLLRLGFGVLWIIDGLLQAQPGLAAGLPAKIIVPAAATSPGWVRDVTGWAAAAWSAHPLAAWVAQMAALPQPSALGRLVSGFASLTAAHGFGINELAVAALAGIGLGLASGRRALLRVAVGAAAGRRLRLGQRPGHRRRLGGRARAGRGRLDGADAGMS